MNIFQTVHAHAQDMGGKLAILTEQDGSRTYAELADRSRRLALAMIELGFKPGDRVVLWMPNYPEYIDCFIALSGAGLSAVPLNPDWTDEELQFVVDHCKAVAIVTDSARAERAKAALRRSGNRGRVLVVKSGSGGEIPPETDDIEDLVARNGAPGRRDGLQPPESGEFMLLYTSGTTSGRPKGVVMRRGRPGSVNYREAWGIREADRCITVSPFFHANGLLAGAIHNLALGGSVVFPRKFSARRFWPLVDRYRPSYFISLVGIVNILTTLPESRLEKENSLQLIVALGSAPQAEALKERFGVPIMDWYGMTEGGAGTCTRLHEERRPGSAGRRFAHSTMQIVRSDGVPTEPNEIGEVVFRPDEYFNGYFNDPESTAEVVRDGWVWSGDLGYFDKDGYFYFVDRKKDIVRRGGENISTIEVEEAIRSHGSVKDVAVVAAPHSILGEVVAAFVVSAEGHTVDLEAIREHVSTRLAPFKLPEELHVVDALPKTGNGKVEKFLLRKQLRRQSGAIGLGS